MTDGTPPAGPLICPGCGGRNAPSAPECDWCGRSFSSPSHRLRLAGWQIVSTLLLLAVIGAVVALVAMNAQRDLGLPRPAAVVPATPSATPTLPVTPRVTVMPTPSPRVTPTPSPAPAEAGPPAAAPRRTARVVNTGGQGLIVRGEAGAQSQQVGTLREGTVVVLEGGETSIAARLWREILDESRGIRGWVQADFLQEQP